ncbi:MAG: DNA translocase FtsK 4TM domain-containing protein, partial [Paludibacteraceae bacterium]|nr:DNA translocase FtsK 4TM domain-containing protein [Paludibacteraceae bacterium]
MPRHSSKTRDISFEQPEERAIRVDKLSGWQAVRAFFDDRRVRMVFGVLLLMFSIFALLAYASFLFTGAYDQDILTLNHAERVANRETVRNMLGLPGADLAHFLINGSFGFVSLLLVLMIGVYGLRVMHVFRDIPAIKIFCCTAFLVLWGAVTLGFAQQMVHLGVFLWGGQFGTWAARWLTSYVQITGTVLILFFSMVIFLIVSDPRFIDRCKAFGAWCAGLFKRRPHVIEEPDTPTEEVTLDLPVEPEPESVEPSDEVTFTIDPIQEEEPEAAGEPLPELDDENEPLGDAPLPVEEPAPSEPSEPSGELEINEVIEDKLYDKDPDKILEKLGPYDPRKDLEFFKFPSLNLLKVYDNEAAPVINEEEQRANGARIVTTLRNYGIEIDSIKATVGPTVTLYEIVPKAGIRVAKIQALENDIMMSLSATGIRIIAPMPGKGTIGIEVPNEKPQVVSMHSVIASKRFQEESKMKLPVAYGRTITNEVFMFDLAKTPHLLVAGATGTGKSVAINAIITSLLYKKHPAELKLVMVDPKMVEFAPYKPLLKHYLAAMPDTDPEQIVITDCDRVINTLNSLVIEMENRYKLLMDAGVRNLEDYNDKFVRRRLNPNKLVADSLQHQYLPYIVIIIDEYGDFIMQAGKQVETPIARITQKARAVG